MNVDTSYHSIVRQNNEVKQKRSWSSANNWDNCKIKETPT